MEAVRLSNLIEIKDLKYRKNYKTILEDVNLEIGSNKIVGLLGENGAGKTTLMRIIAGVAKGYKGEVAINGSTDLVQKKASVSFSDQLDSYGKNEKIEDIVEYYRHIYQDFSMEKYADIAKFLKIKGSNKISELSKGMKEKVVIALAFSRDTNVYLLDEPFSGIDSMSRKKIVKTILEWKTSESTLIISDHHVEDISSILDEIVVVKDETIYTHKNADDIRKEFGKSIEDYYESIYEDEEEE